MTIAAYLRVSSDSQSTDSQEAQVREWIAANGIDEAAVEFFRDVETAMKCDRAALNALREKVRSGKIKTVIVWKLDRLSRKIKDGVAILCEMLEADIRLVVTTQNLDFSGPVGKMVAALLFGVAEIEHQFRKERQLAGIALAKSRKKYRGRRPGTFLAKPSRAVRLKEKGLMTLEIAKILGVSERTVFNYLKVMGRKGAVNPDYAEIAQNRCPLCRAGLSHVIGTEQFRTCRFDCGTIVRDNGKIERSERCREISYA